MDEIDLPTDRSLSEAAAPRRLHRFRCGAAQSAGTASVCARRGHLVLPMRSRQYFVHAREGVPIVATMASVRSDTGALVSPDSQLGAVRCACCTCSCFFGPRWIVGFLGVVMAVLIGTGIVVHRKIIAELFTQRWGRSLRVVMSDLHKAAGT